MSVPILPSSHRPTRGSGWPCLLPTSSGVPLAFDPRTLLTPEATCSRVPRTGGNIVPEDPCSESSVRPQFPRDRSGKCRAFALAQFDLNRDKTGRASRLGQGVRSCLHLQSGCFNYEGQPGQNSTSFFITLAIPPRRFKSFSIIPSSFSVALRSLIRPSLLGFHHGRFRGSGNNCDT